MRHSQFGALFTAASVIALLSSGSAFAQTAVDTRIGAEVRGRLEEGDARTRGGDAYRYDDYRVQLRAGQRLQAELRSSDFDPSWRSTPRAAPRANRWRPTTTAPAAA